MNTKKKSLLVWGSLVSVISLLIACEKIEKPVADIPVTISSSYYINNATTRDIVVEARPNDEDMPVLVLEVAPLTESYFFTARAEIAAGVKPSAFFSELLIYTSTSKQVLYEGVNDNDWTKDNYTTNLILDIPHPNQLPEGEPQA